MSKPLVILCIFAIFAGIGGWFVFSAASHDDAAMGERVTPIDAPEPAGARRPARPLADERARPASAGDESDGERSRPMRFRLRGHVTVADHGGARDEAPSGTLRLEYRGAEGWTPVDVAVSAGHFDIDLMTDAGDFRIVEPLVFDGQRCFVDPDDFGPEFSSVNGEPVELKFTRWPRVSVRGSVRVKGPGGSFVDDVDGSFELHATLDYAPDDELLVRFMDGGGGELVERVQVVGGRFTCELPGTLGYYVVKSPMFGGRAAVLDGYRARDAEDVVLTFVPLSAPILEVKDRSTGRPLGNVVLLETPGDKRPLAPAVREASRVVADGVASPVSLEMPDETLLLWVGAPGYEWREVYIGRSELDPIEVLLQPAGTVRMKVVGAPREGLLALLSTQENDELFARTVDFRTVTLASIPAGEHQLCVYSSDLSLCYHEVTVKVAAGRTTVHTIDLDAFPVDEPSVRVHGRLLIPSEWAIEPSLEFFPLSATLASPQGHVRLTASQFEDLGGGAHEFTVDLAPARYITVMRGASHSWLVEVQPGVASRLDLRLPPPVRVIVTVKGAGADEVVDDQTLWITCEGWNGKEGMAISQMKQYAVGGGFEYRCPRGPVLIKVSAVGFNAQRRVVDVTSSPHRETIVLEPHMGIDITVMRDGEPWPEAWEDGDLEYTLEFLDPIPRRRGEIADEQRLFRSNDARTSVPHAGRYRLRVTSVPKGRDAAPELDVVVEKRAYTAVTLNL